MSTELAYLVCQLTWHTGPMDTPSTDEEKIAEIARRTQRIADDKEWILKTIPEVFPENRGEPPIRGRLTEVVKASGWTREYVARIRDRKGPKT
jgi:hypothetical protein